MSSSHSAPIATARPAVDAALTSFIRRHRARTLEIGPELAPLIDALEAMLAGGKRLRPIFCYWAWRGAGGEDTAEIHTAAASLELLQACALIHDDVIDNSDTRRGLPAAHQRLSHLHADTGLRGDSAEFGRGAAILLGDLCLSWCDEMYQSCGLPDAVLRAGRVPFDLMRTEVMVGQYLDLLEQARGADTVEAALRVVGYKAAKYTVQRPMHLGAALAGRHSELERPYADYGLALGTAFQLRDDVLGVFGDPERTGKPAGDDLREGKRTVMVAETLQRASPAAAAEFRRHLGDPGLTPADVERLREIITASGALQACEERIERYAAEATAALEAAPLAEDAREALATLVVAATARES